MSRIDVLSSENLESEGRPCPWTTDKVPQMKFLIWISLQQLETTGYIKNRHFSLYFFIVEHKATEEVTMIKPLPNRN